MNESVFPFALLCFTSFFTLINPLGTMPVFLSMTTGMSQKEREKIARKATAVAFFIMISFTIFGPFLFQVFGHLKFDEKTMQQTADDISVTPLAIPMLCGPGAIANGIVLMEDAGEWINKAVLLAVIALVFVLTFFILKASTRLVRFMGETGNNVMMRLMGLILMVIAVECFVSGAKPILVDIIQQGKI